MGPAKRALRWPVRGWPIRGWPIRGCPVWAWPVWAWPVWICGYREWRTRVGFAAWCGALVASPWLGGVLAQYPVATYLVMLDDLSACASVGTVLPCVRPRPVRATRAIVGR